MAAAPPSWSKPVEPFTQAAIKAPSSADVMAITEEGFIYGLPIVINDASRGVRC